MSSTTYQKLTGSDAEKKAKIKKLKDVYIGLLNNEGQTRRYVCDGAVPVLLYYLQENEDICTAERACILLLCAGANEGGCTEGGAGGNFEKSSPKVSRLREIQLAAVHLQLSCVLTLLVLQACVCPWDPQEGISLA